MNTKNNYLLFKKGEFIVYPAHGVGKIISIEKQNIAGYFLDLIIIKFKEDKMILRVPITKINSVGIRKICKPEIVKQALITIKSKPKIKKSMWSRRAQEYESKINSGELLALSEVVRDLFRADNQPEQSYSERQLYESALEKMAREIAIINNSTETEVINNIKKKLNNASISEKNNKNKINNRIEAA